MDGERRSGTAFERHAQTVLASIAVLLLGWIGLTTQSTQVKLSKIETAFSIEIQNLKNAVATPDPRINNNTARIVTLERYILVGDERERP